MNPIGKAIWYIEAHLAEELTLDSVATVANVSRFHLSRAFPVTTGHTLTSYIRARRLSEAAKRLAAGAPDILNLALDTGYGSHEAFTRAFRDQFATTPEAIRAEASTATLTLQEPLRMDSTNAMRLAPPAIVTHHAFRVVGLTEHYAMTELAGIPGQWQRFVPHMLALSKNGARQATYGICYNTDGASMDYMCAVEVKDFTQTPPALARLSIGEHLYAHFTHKGHVTEIRPMWQAIFNDWLPTSTYDLAEAPDFERYGEDFNPMTGEGLLELLVPVKKRP